MNRNRNIKVGIAGGILAVLATPLATAGPYSLGTLDAGNAYDAPVPGFIGPHGIGKARLQTGPDTFQNPGNRLNPLFFAWAADYSDYERSDSDSGFNDPALALGPVTGDIFDAVALGDLSVGQITDGNPVGRITVHFAKPIRNLSGADFVVFENCLVAATNTTGAGIGGIFAELAHVEVSADGETFHRFPSASLTPASVGVYGTVNPTNIHNLAGKHVNSYGDSWGTPFDIGETGLSEITHIRFIDIPGNGAFKDSSGRPIYDSWRTTGSGGFDLEAVGAISTAMTYGEWPLLEELPANLREALDDPDGDGVPNLLEYAFGLVPSEPNDPNSGWSQVLVTDGGASFVEIVCTRDERLTDLTREVQVTEDFTTWTTLAKSTGGAPFQAGNGFSPLISDTAAGGIASVGVIREDRVRDTRPATAPGKRFYRLRVTRN